MSVWFVTGASRGLGAEIVREALSRDQQVVAAVRDAETARKEFLDAGVELLVVTLDVTDERQAHEAVAKAVDRFGRIDVLVNNAGRGLLGAVEEASDSAVRAVFDVNVFGLLNVNRAVLPVMRRQRSGYVINIGSVGGFTQGPGLGIYGCHQVRHRGSVGVHADRTRPAGRVGHRRGTRSLPDRLPGRFQPAGRGGRHRRLRQDRGRDTRRRGGAQPHAAGRPRQGGGGDRQPGLGPRTSAAHPARGGRRGQGRGENPVRAVRAGHVARGLGLDELRRRRRDA